MPTAAYNVTQDCWYYWTDQGTATTISATALANAGTWSQWTTTSASTTSAATTITWNNWTAGTSATDYTISTTDATWNQWVVVPDPFQPQGYQPYTPPTAEQQEAWARERAETERKANERAAERAAAVVKAKALLASMLDEQQRAQLERDKFFDFVSQTGRRMRIKSHSSSMNVDELDATGKRVRTLCAHPRDYELPIEDHLVAQLLTLRHDEEAFMRVANVRM